MIQKIPVGVSKITSARNLSSNYKEIIKDLEEDSDSIIGVTNENEIKFVMLSSKKYRKLMKILEERENFYLEKIVEEGLDDYKNGRTQDIDEWLKKNGRY